MKSPGDKCPCGDYCALNCATTQDHCLIPHIHDFLCHSKVPPSFLKSMQCVCVHQISVAPSDVPQTAVTTPFGLFELVNMLFGLRNAHTLLQVLSDVPLVYTNIDNVSITSPTNYSLCTSPLNILEFA